MRIIGWVDTVGSALLAQLLFVVFSVPVITCAPAAIALQQQLVAIADGRPSGVRVFAADFRAAWRHTWPIGVLFALVAVGLSAAIPFWFVAGAWYGYAAAGVLCALGGFALAIWLCILASAEFEISSGSRDLAARALQMVMMRTGRVLIGLVLALTWLALAWMLPALLLVGSGLAPAVIVRAVVATTRTARA